MSERGKVTKIDALEGLARLEDESVQCVITSPPYWGLRDYGTATWEGGDKLCQHTCGGQVQDTKAPGAISTGVRPGCDASVCRKCGAIRHDKGIGLEKTPEAYIEKMVEVFRGVRRVLRKDGTLWLNMGDCYAGSWGNSGRRPELDSGAGGQREKNVEYFRRPGWDDRRERPASSYKLPNLKPKDLCGMPWRLAFALQADGWWLRCDVIWSKPNPMPESVRDRPTKSHEYLFLLTKSARYYYDQDAVREDGAPATLERDKYNRHEPRSASLHHGKGFMVQPANTPTKGGRNLRSVWTIATQPFPEAHFATFPEKLVEPCIKAGTSEKGCCTDCGAPWERITERETHFEGGSGKAGRTAEDANATGKWAGKQHGTNLKLGPVVEVRTIEWRPTCSCGTEHPIPKEELEADPSLLDDFEIEPYEPIPCLVLDPFAGSGTVGVVAWKLGRDFIGFDLNPGYCKMANRRMQKEVRGDPAQMVLTDLRKSEASE